jgi:hypothetical protein
LAAFNQCDVDAALRNCRTDVELKRIDGSPEERDLARGRAAVAEFLAPQAFERQSVEPLAIFEGERVAVLSHPGGRSDRPRRGELSPHAGDRSPRPRVLHVRSLLDELVGGPR